MDNSQTPSSIVKIVYFDEGSATDFVQLRRGGALEFMIKESNTDSTTDSTDAEASIEGKVGIARLFRIGASASGNISSSSGTETVVNSVVTNTVLTDFLELVESEDDPMPTVQAFDGCQIEQIPGSISGISLLTPYFSMFRGGQTIEAGDFDIALDKLDSTLSKAKGYFEFLGVPNVGEPVVFRFNGLAFKNNYRPANLLSMNLKIYAIEVGECRLSDFDAEQEFAVEGFTSKQNPDYTENKEENRQQLGDKLKMYDALLAGVSVRGK